jgi:hypothetical protein
MRRQSKLTERYWVNNSPHRVGTIFHTRADVPATRPLIRTRGATGLTAFETYLQQANLLSPVEKTLAAKVIACVGAAVHTLFAQGGVLVLRGNGPIDLRTAAANHLCPPPEDSLPAFTSRGLVVYRAGANQLGIGPREMIAACHPHHRALQVYRYDLTDHEGLLWQYAPLDGQPPTAAEQRAALYDFHQFLRIWQSNVSALQADVSPRPLISNTSLANQALVGEWIVHGLGQR